MYTTETHYLTQVEGILKKLNDILFPQTPTQEIEPIEGIFYISLIAAIY